MEYSKLTIKDEAFSGEKFNLIKDEYGVLKTNPQPKDITPYYNFDTYISHQSEKRTGITWVYNTVKELMQRSKLRLLLNFRKDIHKVLDVGCGTGDFIEFLESKYIKAEGIEPTPIARDKAKKKNLHVYRKIDDCENTFDAITLFHVLEHVENYNKTIDQLIKKLKPNGLILIAVPNYKSYDANYYKDKWAAWDVPRHLWHFNKSDMLDLGKRHNLELLKIKGMPWDAFYISMVSEAYKGNSKLKGVFTGLLSNFFALATKEYSSNLFLFQKRDLKA